VNEGHEPSSRFLDINLLRSSRRCDDFVPQVTHDSSPWVTAPRVETTIRQQLVELYRPIAHLQIGIENCLNLHETAHMIYGGLNDNRKIGLI
jgi:hypothetical protein